MIVLTYKKPLGYHINGEFFSRRKSSVISEYRGENDIGIYHACDIAKALGKVVTLRYIDGCWRITGTSR